MPSYPAWTHHVRSPSHLRDEQFEKVLVGRRGMGSSKCSLTHLTVSFILRSSWREAKQLERRRVSSLLIEKRLFVYCPHPTSSRCSNSIYSSQKRYQNIFRAFFVGIVGWAYLGDTCTPMRSRKSRRDIQEGWHISHNAITKTKVWSINFEISSYYVPLTGIKFIRISNTYGMWESLSSHMWWLISWVRVLPFFNTSFQTNYIYLYTRDECSGS